jgi:hypothetical protein
MAGTAVQKWPFGDTLTWHRDDWMSGEHRRGYELRTRVTHGWHARVADERNGSA